MKKRVLYLNSTQSNYMADLTLAGLYEANLDVVEIPSMNHKQNIRRPKPVPFVTINDIIKLCRIKAFDVCIVSNIMEGEAASLFIKLSDVLKENNIPVVVLDDADSPNLTCHTTFSIAQMRDIDYVFKRELSDEIVYNMNVIKYLYASDFNSISEIEKRPIENDIMFYGAVCTTDRIQLTKFLNNYAEQNKVRLDIKTAGLYDNLSQYTIQSEIWKSYIASCSASKICFCPPGHGIDTLRFWEIAAIDGPFIFIPEKTAQYYDFNKGDIGAVVVYKNDLSDLDRKIQLVLKWYDDISDKIKKRIEFIKSNHTCGARIKAVLNQILITEE